jgi:hypothetical protein
MPIFFMNPPTWLYGIVALLTLLADVIVIYGAVFLITRWRVLTRDIKVIIATLFLVNLAAGAIFGWLATLPFGFFGGLPALFFFDSQGLWTHLFLVAAGCVVNTVGLLGIFGFIFSRLGGTNRIR